MRRLTGEIESGLRAYERAKPSPTKLPTMPSSLRPTRKFKTAKCDNYKAFGMFNSSIEFFMCIMPVAIMAFGGWLIMRDDMNYADLITFYLYIATFITPIRKLAVFTETFMNGWAGLTRFTEIMRMEPEIADAPDAVDLIWEESEDDAPMRKGAIDIRNVSFAYDDGGPDEDVLVDLSLRISPGETVAIVGPSGGGKTTLCQLVPRFYDVDEGSIKINGIDIRRVKISSLRKSIGIVQQDVFLFADTLAENIRYGRPGATDEEVYEAARKAEIYDDIMAMPDRFDSYAGERGDAFGRTEAEDQHSENFPEESSDSHSG